MKSALITGIAGQDGSYLAEYLLERGYQVWGLVRRDPASTRWLQPIQSRIEAVYGDLRDAESLAVAFQKAWPDEVYNLAGQVFVPTSWEFPAETFDINVGGLVRLLQIVERTKRDTRVYQASSSEMMGNFDGLCSEADAVPSHLAVRYFEDGRPSLDGGLSPKGPVRGGWDSLQSRVTPPRSGDGDAQNHASRRALADG